MRKYSEESKDEGRHSVVSDRLIESISVTDEKKRKKGGILNNWVLLSLIAACLFALRIILVGNMTSLGFDGLYFFSTGSVILSSTYFIYQKEWAKLNNPLDINDIEKKKVMLRTWDNKFDCWALCVCMLTAVHQVLFYCSVVLAARASRLSGLNLGITTAIWSF